MRTLPRLPRGTMFTAPAVTLYLLARAASSFDRPVARFPDSIGYEALSFVGRNDRFWPVPLVFHLVSSDGGRVAAHVIIGAVAWSWLAIVVSRGARYPRAMLATVLVVGLSPQVIRYDLAILSESLGISFAVMAVAATVWAARSPTLVSRACALGAFTACVLTRPTHLVVLTLCLGGATLATIRARGGRMVPTALVLVALSAWGFSLLAGNRPTSELNLYTVLADRVITSDARYAWFVERGMPDVPGVRSAEGYDFTGDLPPDLAALVDLPDGQQPPAIIRAGGLKLARWVRADGWSTYARFVVEHPADSWERVTALTNSVLDPPNDDFLPLEPRPLVPRAFFGAWLAWVLAGALAVAAGFARPGGARIARMVVAMSAATFLVHAATLLASGIEHQRHASTVAVVVRVLALCAVGNALAPTTGNDDPTPAGRRGARRGPVDAPG